IDKRNLGLDLNDCASIMSKKEARLTHDLESDSVELRKAAVERVLREKSLSVKEVRSIAEKHVAGLHKHGTAKDAILLLVKLRAVDEIPWLVSQLTFEVFYKETKRPQPPEDVFPAAQALIDIGQPSIQPVLDRVKGSGDHKIYLAAATVLRGVLGDQK